MKPRKLLSILLALTMLLTFVGCQSAEDPDDTEDEVVGGGLIQARDGEDEVIEAEDPITDAVEDEDLAEVDLIELSDIAPEEGVSFYALVITVGISADEDGTGYIDVCGLNCNDVNHKGLYTVGISTDTGILNGADELTVNDLNSGDIVVITYDGEVMETYPARISSASRIYVATRIYRLSEIASYLPDGYEDFGDYFPDWDSFVY